METTQEDLKNYILVKDKDGQLKYFKDGKFYSLVEAGAEKKSSIPKWQKEKLELTPVSVYKPKTRVLRPLPGKEREVREIESDTGLNGKRIMDQRIVEEKVAGVIAQLKMQFTDEKTKERFVNVLRTFFRGIRGAKEIEYMLLLPKISGGMELEKNKVDLIVSVIRQYAEEISRERKQVFYAPAEPAVETVPPADLPEKAVAAKEEKETEKPVQPMTRPAVQKPMINQPIAGKPRMSDIGARRQLIGPLEELEYMTIENFRLIGKEKSARVEEILEKFQLLAEQSLPKKWAGIKAFKASPIYRLYLTMNMQGIKEDKSIQEVIEDLQFKNEPCLTLSEYEAINEINSRITY
ncbi:hypothetical protein KKC32_00265 [Patescibacteria group bacterium]|nr:hypothetical protein [Patescibacteria group bacterium]